ncbi:MAG: hypothetical protein ACFN0W_11290 [Propionibacterium acidifaciens]|uniref:hypothetical protein n=1 Tax=Propionibacterium acidifaciens TaxID=556499 RepID=UPI003609EE03
MGYRPGRVPASVRDRLHDLVETSDRDFVPPLSWRAAIGESTWAAQSLGRGVEPYFASLMARAEIITVGCDRTIAGFCAFQYPCAWRGRDYLYVSTAIIAPAFRGRRLTSRFVPPIALTALRHRVPILAKTWSSNTRCVRALSRWARVVESLPSDRAPGVDTLYWRFDPGVAVCSLVSRGVR